MTMPFTTPPNAAQVAAAQVAPEQQLQQPAYRQPDQPRTRTKLNLDTIEREGGPTEPFEFTLGGRDYTLSDPQDVDWQELLVAMNHPVSFFRYVLPKADQPEFFDQKMPSWKMNVLMRKYQQHYGLPDAGEAVGLPR
jgi:hypothetical protein